MKKWCFMVSAILALAMLTGCSGEPQAVSSIKVSSEHELRPLEAGDIIDLVGTSVEPREAVGNLDIEPDETEPVVIPHEIDANINLLGIEAIVEDDEPTGGAEDTEVRGMTAMLKAGKVYEITAQVLISQADDKPIEALKMQMTFPNLIKGEGMIAPLSASLYVDNVLSAEDESRIGSLSYDLALAYVPGSYQLCQVTGEGSAAEYTASGDVTWEQLDEISVLEYPVIFTEERRVVEYLLRYRVKAEVSKDQQVEAEAHAKNPIKLDILGFSQTHALQDDEVATTGAALTDCLRGDYFLPEAVTLPDDLASDQVDNEGYFVITEVKMPEWALEEGSKNGLIISQYSYWYGERNLCVMKAELDGYPDNYAAKDKIEIKIGNEKTHYWINGFPVTRLAIWRGPEGNQIESELIDTVPFAHADYDATRSCRITSFNLTPEQIRSTEGHFYLVLGYDVKRSSSD